MDDMRTYMLTEEEILALRDEIARRVDEAMAETDPYSGDAEERDPYSGDAEEREVHVEVHFADKVAVLEVTARYAKEASCPWGYDVEPEWHAVDSAYMQFEDHEAAIGNLGELAA